MICIVYLIYNNNHLPYMRNDGVARDRLTLYIDVALIARAKRAGIALSEQVEDWLRKATTTTEEQEEAEYQATKHRLDELHRLRIVRQQAAAQVGAQIAVELRSLREAWVTSLAHIMKRAVLLGRPRLDDGELLAIRERFKAEIPALLRSHLNEDRLAELWTETVNEATKRSNRLVDRERRIIAGEATADDLKDYQAWNEKVRQQRRRGSQLSQPPEEYS